MTATKDAMKKALAMKAMEAMKGHERNVIGCKKAMKKALAMKAMRESMRWMMKRKGKTAMKTTKK